MSIETILIVDDEPIIREFLSTALSGKNYSVETASCGKNAMALLKQKHFDLVISDMNMPDITGLKLLQFVKETSQNTEVIIITGFGSIDNAVEAMQAGAYSYLTKPFSLDAITAMLAKVDNHINLVRENTFLRSEASKKSSPNSIIANSPLMQKILANARKIAKSNASVFIHGESGTGKEVLSSFIHSVSLRASKPYIKVNCAAIPEALAESEFFGHEKGSFTGALSKKPGRFELANDGTLLLDEITEIPMTLQPKLLRAIQEMEFERVGGTKPVSVDIRFIATSNRNVRESITQKIFREDLYYRLNVIPLHLPPLRERKEDIIPLALSFLEKSCRKNGKPIPILSKECEFQLLNYGWPGNVRELVNVIERAVVLSSNDTASDFNLIIHDLSLMVD